MLLKKAPAYPESDGKPMADNTIQAFWIFVLFGNLMALFRDRADVFVAADNLWYPVEGDDSIRIAPDVYVVIGRPKGDRASYQQWNEGGIPLTVVFEIYSPGNDWQEMMEKRDFCEEHGTEEFYIYDPYANRLFAYTRGPHGAALARRRFMGAWTSPRLGIRFDLSGKVMRVCYPSGEPFLSFDQLKTLQEQESARAAEEASLRQKAEEALAAERGRSQRLARMVELLSTPARSPEEEAELSRLRSQP